MLFCRVRPTPKNPGSTSIPKDGSRSPTAPNFPPGDAREDWAILRALSETLGHTLPFDSLAALRATLYRAHPHMARLDEIAEGPIADFTVLESPTLGRDAFLSPVVDFYQTNPIARASKVMAEASAIASGGLQQAAE